MIKFQFFSKIRIFILSFAAFFIFPNLVSAQIKIDVDRTYTITEDYKMEVNEVHTVSNETGNLFIPATENVEFQILGFRIEDTNNRALLEQAVQTVEIKEGNLNKRFNTEYSTNAVILSVPYGEGVYPGDVRRFSFNYTHPGLVYKNGAVLDAYIHAFSPEFQFESNTTEYNYSSRLIFPSTLPEINFISPQPARQSRSGNNIVFDFDQEQLVNKFVWLQLGKIQYYNFEIEQIIEPTENVQTGLKNRYEIILPRDIVSSEVSQRVLFSDITPAPIGTYLDGEGNLIGVFEFFSNVSTKVIIKGYAVLNRSSDLNYLTTVEDKNSISPELIEKYTQPAEYWEVDNQQIIEKSNEIVKDQSNNVFAITEAIYQNIVDSIDYSDVKRFGINERQGALKTLQGGAAVCMEYSDLFLSLMRAQQIPTRAVFGYGYDPRVDSAEQEAHQWVQVYMPGLRNNWVDVDVTWGESGDILIGGDLNHFYTHVAYKDPNTPALISRYAYGANQSFETPDFNIETEAELPNNINFLSQEQLLVQYPLENKTKVEYYLEQIVNRIGAGFMSLQQGLNLNNGSQKLALLVLILGLLIVSVLIRSVLKKSTTAAS